MNRDRTARVSTARSTRRRRARPILAVLAAFALGGCATKQDIRDLRAEMESLRARQDSVLVALTRQNRAILDSLTAGTELVLGVRGDLSQQLVQMEQQLIQIQELTGQSQRRLSELRSEFQERVEMAARRPDTTDAAPAVEGADSGAVAQLYRIGQDQLRRGLPGTARTAFVRIVQQNPDHRLAPDAQFQIAETYALEQQHDRALRELERVVELFPGSDRAPHALYRAGVISQDRGNIEAAREYFQKVVDGYPDSDVARVARNRLTELGS